MKKLISLSTIALFVAFTANTGCVKSSSGTTNPILNLPNIASFAIQAITDFVPGAAAGVTISAPNLGAGTFTVNFNLTSSTTPADNMSNQTATFTLSSGSTTASFQTPKIPSGGNVSITINSISNSSGSSNVTSNNTWSFNDSTGLMTGTYTPSGGSAQAFRATDVSAVLAGTNLQLVGTIWTPNLTAITLRDIAFTGATGSVAFDITNPATNGSAVYQVTGSSVLINDLASTGTITFTSTSPLLVGTFNFTNQDGSVVSGSFSCPHP